MASLPAFAAQITPRREPPPEGQRIEARDGDVIVVENDDRVRVVRRRHAAARVVMDETRNLLVVLADWEPAGGRADGTVDQAWRMSIADGRWPLEPRWEGPVVIEEEQSILTRPSASLSIETPAGLIVFYSGPIAPANARPAIAVIRLQGYSAGDTTGLSFDQSERQQLSANPPVGNRMSFSGPGSAGSGGVSWSSSASVPATGAVNTVRGPGQPIRVGGGIPPPRKIHHVTPAMPEEAVKAGIQGIVIVEITVAEDGSVQNPRVLRSIPMLDQAALNAVGQWRYEPPLLNGQPVPVILTVTVPFTPAR
jgi:protein TonB